VLWFQQTHADVNEGCRSIRTNPHLFVFGGGGGYEHAKYNEEVNCANEVRMEENICKNSEMFEL
jgi:hypothetical protein